MNAKHIAITNAINACRALRMSDDFEVDADEGIEFGDDAMIEFCVEQGLTIEQVEELIAQDATADTGRIATLLSLNEEPTEDVEVVEEPEVEDDGEDAE